MVALDGREIDDATDLTTGLAQRQPGDRVVSLRVEVPGTGELLLNYRTRR